MLHTGLNSAMFELQSGSEVQFVTNDHLASCSHSSFEVDNIDSRKFAETDGGYIHLSMFFGKLTQPHGVSWHRKSKCANKEHIKLKD